MPTELPEIRLPIYFHTFAVKSQDTARIATQLMARYGLLALGEEYQLGNISGDILYTLSNWYAERYGDFTILTSWTDKSKLLHRNGGEPMEEYGIHNRISKKQKQAIARELDEIIIARPNDNYFGDLRSNLNWLSQILPADNFSWALFGDEHIPTIFRKISSEIILGSTKFSNFILPGIHIRVLSEWLSNHPDSIISNTQTDSLNDIARTIMTDVNHNLLIWEIYELYHCTDAERDFPMEERVQHAQRSLSRINNYHLLQDPGNPIIREHLPIIRARAETIGLNVEGLRDTSSGYHGKENLIQ